MRLLQEAYFSCGYRLAALGDAIVMSPIVRRFARDSDKLYFPVRVANYHTVQCLFQDLYNVDVFAYTVDAEIEQYLSTQKHFRINAPEIHMTDIHLPGIPGAISIPINWDRQLYEFYDIPFSARYHEFRLPRRIDGADALYDRLTEGATEYCLVHQQTYHHARGEMQLNLAIWRQLYNLPPLKIIEITPDITNNMLEYIRLIENAREIHCVPSSFFCLVDSITERTQATLYYHDIRATTMMQVNSKWNNFRWNVVKYDKKL